MTGIPRLCIYSTVDSHESKNCAMYDLLLPIDFSGPIVARAATVASRYCNENFKFFCVQAQNFRKFIVHLQQTTRRGHPTGRFCVHFGTYQRTVRGAAWKALNVAVASVSANTCVLPSSAV